MSTMDDSGLGTRERLLDAALALFAERGYQATSVGQIEASVGLRARAGGFYRHFSSKEAVLAAALQRYIDAIDAAATVEGLLPLGDVRAELLVIGRWTLRHLARNRALLRILYREGDRLPATARQALRRVTDDGYASAQRWFASNLEQARRGEAQAMTVAALGSLFNYAANEALFGEPPSGVPADEFVRAWADAWTEAVNR